MKSQRLEMILALLLLFAGCLTAAAQDTPFNASATSPPAAEGRNDTDPPGRVARIQYVSGEVSIQPGGVNDWIAADLNRPLTTSDRVWTDADSKAELNVGGAYIRMNSESSLTLTNVSNNTVQLEFDQGTLELTVRYLGGGQIYEVDTPNLAFTVMKPGVYRFDVFPGEDQTWVTVRQGYGEATGSGNAVKIKAGHQVRFSGGNSLQHVAERGSRARWFRRLGKRARSAARQLGVGAIRFSRGHRLPGPRHIRHLANSCALRASVGADQRSRRMGAVSLRALGVDRSLGLDVG